MRGCFLRRQVRWATSTDGDATRLLPVLVQDERTPLAAAFSSRPHSWVGPGAAGSVVGVDGGLLVPAAGARGGSRPGGPPQHTKAQQAVTQSLLAAKESEAELLRQQLQQLTTDFKFNLKVGFHRRARPLMRFRACWSAVMLGQVICRSFVFCSSVHSQLLRCWVTQANTHPIAALLRTMACILSVQCLTPWMLPVILRHVFSSRTAATAVQLLEERDAELERVDIVLAGLREAAATRDAALSEARTSLAAKEAALRDKEARLGG